jgi:iron complex transport system permease protein
LETKQNTLTKEEVKIQYNKFIGRKIFFILFLLAAIILVAGISASSGSANLSIRETYSSILHRLFPAYFEPGWLADVCIWNLRLPRIFMGTVAGFGLGVAGCVTQAILKNPLASPYTLGISSGAGFGASLALLTGAGIVGGDYLVIGNAFLFALLCSFIILGLSNRKGATPETMILAGIAMMYLFAAMTTILQYFGEAEAVKEAVFWTVGDLDRASWPRVAIITGTLACCFPLLMFKSLDLNLMASGDETAASLGVNVKRTRIILMAVTTLLVACIVCFTGTIGFIGLVAPHLTRIAIGGDNRFVLPVSGLFGSLLLISADLVARRVLAPIILPVGAITAFMGAPLFLYMIMKRKREYW